MQIIQQDLLTIKKGILFHQVNCQGIMGGGIARAFALKFPDLESTYRVFCKKEKDLLGKVLLYTIPQIHRSYPNDLYIANIFGQHDISTHSRQTSYDATCDAFERIKKLQAKDTNSVFSRYADRLYFPFKMGCGLGGGSWPIYSAIINHYFPNAIICQYE